MTSKTKPKTYDPIPVGSVLMALDVSSSATGIAIGRIKKSTIEVVDFLVAKPSSGWDFERKIKSMTYDIDETIMLHRVTHIAMEWQDHRLTARAVQGLAVLGQAQGAIWKHLSDFKVDRVPVREATKLNGKNTKKATRCEWIKDHVPSYKLMAEGNTKFDPGMDASDALMLLFYRANQK